MLRTVASLAESSIKVIEDHQHASGAYPACPAYPVYRYSWLRDGAFIADAMSRAGRVESADRFFTWCAAVIDARRDRIVGLVERSVRGESVGDDELLPTRYTLDGADDQSDWWNFQLDGYGTWLWALAAHAARHGVPLGGFRSSVRSTTDYLTAFGKRPCYDWWEEHVERRHTSTIAAVAAGLSAAAAMADEDGVALLDPDRLARSHVGAAELIEVVLTDASVAGHLTKWSGSDAVDGSLLACLTAFGTVEPGSPTAERTYDAIRGQLLADGVYRYRGDTFYGGGEWIILTAWLGWYEALTGRVADAQSRLDWIARQATPDGLLPEQVSGRTQQPEFIAEWTKRWGPVATPLLWSHAMFLTLALESGNWSA